MDRARDLRRLSYQSSRLLKVLAKAYGMLCSRHVNHSVIDGISISAGWSSSLINVDFPVLVTNLYGYNHLT